jgi:molybdopterin-containing oxidoreductase family iron-sulfur binding subunit
VRPSEIGAAIGFLYNAIAAKSGGISIVSPPLNEKAAGTLGKVAEQLLDKKGASLVVSASNNIDEQKLVNKINELLGNYGATIDLTNPSFQRQGNEQELSKMIADLEAGAVDTIIVFDNANPVYDYPESDKFKVAFSKAKTRVSFAGTLNETGELCNVIAPNHHFLESWGDAEPKKGQLSLIQPTISPLFNTRESELSLLKWAGSSNVNWKSDAPYYEYLKSNWGQNFIGDESWDQTLH